MPKRSNLRILVRTYPSNGLVNTGSKNRNKSLTCRVLLQFLQSDLLRSRKTSVLRSGHCKAIKFDCFVDKFDSVL